MIILSLDNINISFGEKNILRNISFGLNEGDKLGIVGVNGAGKSLLLKTITGKISPESGGVYISRDKKISYLEQNDYFDPEKTIFDEMLPAFSELCALEEKLAQLYEKMNDKNDSNNHMALAKEYTLSEEKFRTCGGYEYKNRIKSMLCSLGFDEERQKSKTSTLSGGQKTRLCLARTLLCESDILILDEPTNHLDIKTVVWLEEFLSSYKKTLLVVSHDRYFLDKVTNKTFEIENGEGKMYNVPYTKFVEQKQKNLETDIKHYEMQKREIERMEAFIENQRRWNRQRNIIAAESRMKAIERMDKLERPKNAPGKISMKFSSGEHKLLSDNILEARELTKGFSGKTLFSGVSFVLHSRERMFIFGQNGVGKSTLLKILSGKITEYGGSFEYINKIKIGYYDQEHQGLNPGNTVLEELWDDFPDKNQNEIRSILARFLFTADDVEKKVSSLSGGEKARLTFAKMMLEKLNLLILDEPTNHLDAQSREVLEDALSEYDGTILAVSHDRYFIKKLATRIMELYPGGYFDYTGGYEDFCEYVKNHPRDAKTGERGEDSKKDNKSEYIKGKEEKSIKRKNQKQLSDTENEILKIEERLSEIEKLMQENASDYIAAAKFYEETEKLNLKLEELYEKLEKLTEACGLS